MSQAAPRRSAIGLRRSPELTRRSPEARARGGPARLPYFREAMIASARRAGLHAAGRPDHEVAIRRPMLHPSFSHSPGATISWSSSATASPLSRGSSSTRPAPARSPRPEGSPTGRRSRLGAMKSTFGPGDVADRVEPDDRLPQAVRLGREYRRRCRGPGRRDRAAPGRVPGAWRHGHVLEVSVNVMSSRRFPPWPGRGASMTMLAPVASRSHFTNSGRETSSNFALGSPLLGRGLRRAARPGPGARRSRATAEEAAQETARRAGVRRGMALPPGLPSPGNAGRTRCSTPAGRPGPPYPPRRRARCAMSRPVVRPIEGDGVYARVRLIAGRLESRRQRGHAEHPTPGRHDAVSA